MKRNDLINTAISSSPALFLKNANANQCAPIQQIKGNRASRRRLKAFCKRLGEKLFQQILKTPLILKKMLREFGLVLSIASLPTISYANPQEGQVAEGSATIDYSDSDHTIITQTSDKAIVNWQSFDIAPGEHTQFIVPSSSSTTLNRVVSDAPSEIFGRMSSNGRVILVNQNGILFGAGSRVDVNTLISSSADITDENFMSGNMDFSIKGKSDAEIRNDGEINVDDNGVVALVAPRVTNNGIISAHLGRVTLAATDRWVLDAGGLVKMVIDDYVATELIQSGHIQADGGVIHLTAAVMKDVLSTVINMSGVTRARSVGVEQNGEIVLYAGDWNGNAGGTINISGTMDVQGDNADETGGAIHISGQQVAVYENANIDASGHSGGGEILIGGDYQGKSYQGNVEVTAQTSGGTSSIGNTVVSESLEDFHNSTGGMNNAEKLFIGEDAKINVSSDHDGDAGRAILWSDDYTQFHGTIQAKGGSTGGDGGFVETSGKNILDSTGLVDASAVNGESGDWLLDPNNITISDAASSNVAGDPNWTTTANSGVVQASDIEAALNVGTSVTITTGSSAPNSEDGDITVSANIEKTGGGDATLTLNADDQIFVDDGVKITSNTGELNLTLEADQDIDVGANVEITTNGGDVTFHADYDNNNSGAIEVGDGVTTTTIATAGGDITMGGGSNPTSDYAVGSIDGTYDHGVSLDKATLSAGDGNISIKGIGEATGTTNRGVGLENGVTVQTTYTGSSTTSGNITIDGTGGAGTTSNQGVTVTDSGTLITSVDGDIKITGTGGNGSSNSNYGVFLNNQASITTTGTGVDAGNITIDATAVGGTDGNYGIDIRTLVSITTNAGDIGIKGTGAGSGTVGHGIFIRGESKLTSTSGDITLTGIEDDDASAVGIQVSDRSTSDANILGGSTSGDIILIADTMQFDTGELTATTTGSYIFKTITADVDINISNTTTGGLDISTTELGMFDQTGNTGWNLVAHGDVLIDDGADLTTQSGGIGIVINSDSDATSGGAIRIGDNGGDFSILTSNGGDITLGGGADPTATAAIASTDGVYDIGVYLDEAKLLSSAGDITIIGEGDSTGTENRGVQLENETVVQTTGEGNITITGVGGAGTDSNHGIQLTTSGTKITVDGGDIYITGNSSGTGNNNRGVDIAGEALVESTGTGGTAGNINITGTANTTSAGSHTIGLRIVKSGTKISAVDGDITLTGVGGSNAGATSRFGIHIRDNSYIESTGDSVITLDGTGQNGDEGIYIEDIPGTSNASEIGGSSATGDIILITDNIFIETNELDADTSGSYIIKTKTAGVDINIGNNAGGLDISNAELGMFDQTGNTGWNLVAHGDIVIDNGADLTTQSGGIGIVINSDSDATSGGGIIIGDNGGDLSKLTSNGGAITLGGGVDPTTTAAIGTSAIGVQINEAELLSGAGNISIRGEGESNASDNYGILIQNDSVIQSTGEGDITLVGTGGAGADNNYGIWMQTANDKVSSDGGDIVIIGTGAGSGAANHGINLNLSSTIESTGSGGTAGNITITAAASSAATGADAVGLHMANSAKITAVDGDISITGTGGASASSGRFGIRLRNNSIITSTGDSNITFDGTGQSGDEGIYIEDAGTNDPNEIGGSSATGDITFITDGLFIETGEADIDTSGNYILKTKTAGTDINLFSGSGGLDISTAEIDLFATGSEGIVFQAHDDININSSDDLSNYGAVILRANDTITQSTTDDLTTNGLTVYHADYDGTSGGAISISGGDITTNGGELILSGGDSAYAGSDNVGEADHAAYLTYLRDTGTATGNVDSSHDDGVEISSSTINTGAGNISIRGTGEGTNGSNFGVNVVSSTVTTSGDINIIGVGGNGDTSFNNGVRVSIATVETTGTGNINLTGTANSSATGTYASGVLLGALAVIDATNGDITITGIGSDNGTERHGILMVNNSTISSDGDSNITLDGIGKSGDAGIYIGEIGANDANKIGGASATGDIKFITDSIEIESGELAAETSGNIIFETKSDATTIGLGGATGTLQLDDSELAAFTDGASSIQFGSATHTAVIEVDSYTGWTDDLTLETNTGVISFNGDQTSTAAITVSSNTISELGAATTLTGTTITLNALDANSNNLVINADSLITAAISEVADVTFTADALNIGGAISGQGAEDDLILQGKTNSTTMGIGTGAAGTISLTNSEITNLGTGWDSLQFGNGSTTGDVVVNASTWSDNVSFLSDSGVITFAGDQDAGANDITITSNSTTALSADTKFTGGAIILAAIDSFSNALAVAASSLVTSTIANANDVTFTADALNIGGAISGQGAGDDFILQGKTNSTTIGIGTGAAGTISLLDAEVTNIGTGWDSLQFGNGSTTGNVAVNAATWSDGVTFMTDSGVITFNGDQNAGTNNITVNSNTAASLASDTAFTGAVVALSALNAGSNALTVVANSLIAGAISNVGDATLTVDLINLGGSISGQGAGDDFILQGKTNSETIGIGTGAAGNISLLDSEVTNIGTGWDSLQFGNGSTTGNVVVNAVTWSDNVSFLSDSGVITFAGDQDAGTNNITVNSNTAASLASDTAFTGAVVTLSALNSGSNALTVVANSIITGAISNVGDATLTANLINLGGTISGQGAGDDFILQGKTNSTTIGIGTGAAGTISLIDSEVTNIGTGWDSLQFGNGSTTGDIDVAANSWDDSVSFISDSGLIGFSGVQQFNGNAIAIQTSSAFTMSDNVTDAGKLSITAASISGGKNITATELTTNTTGNTNVGNIALGAGELDMTANNIIIGGDVTSSKAAFASTDLTFSGTITSPIINFNNTGEVSGDIAATTVNLNGSKATLTGLLDGGAAQDSANKITKGTAPSSDSKYKFNDFIIGFVSIAEDNSIEENITQDNDTIAPVLFDTQSIVDSALQRVAALGAGQINNLKVISAFNNIILQNPLLQMKQNNESNSSEKVIIRDSLRHVGGPFVPVEGNIKNNEQKKPSDKNLEDEEVWKIRTKISE